MARRSRPALAHAPHGEEVVWDALVFQGGGALGAYECGAYEALAAKGFDFDLVGGVSVGAANAAIVASRGSEASTYLGRFWDDLADPMAEVTTSSDPVRRQVSAWKSALLGNPAMFVPRWVTAPWTLPSATEWTSLYSSAPYAHLLRKHIDFPALRESPRRLIVTAVDIQCGEVVLFDSRDTKITVEHILASGALPPAFPAVHIGDRAFWDGGIVSNSPARGVLRALPPEDHRRLVLIELFPKRHHIPRNLEEVLGTMKDLTYMDKLGEDTRKSRADLAMRRVLDECLAALPPKTRARMQALPEFVSVLETHRHDVDLYVLTHADEKGELSTKDYDFSPTSLALHRRQGHRSATAAIADWQTRPGWAPFGSFRRRPGRVTPRPVAPAQRGAVSARAAAR